MCKRTSSPEEIEARLSALASSPSGLTKIAEVMKEGIIGIWLKPLGVLKCYKCGSENIEIQLGWMEHWSGIRKHCFDCDYRSYGLEAPSRGHTVVELRKDHTPKESKND